MSTIPDLRFRPAAGEQEAAALLAVHLDRAERDGYDPFSSVEAPITLDSVAAGLRHAAASGTLDRYFIAEASDEIIGYGRIIDWTEEDGTRVWLHVGWIKPARRGCGAGTQLLQRLEERIRVLAAAEAPARWEYAANASSSEPEATQLLLDNGYRAAYTVLEMGLDWDVFEATLERTAWPSGFVLRPVAPEHVAAIAQSVFESYRDEYAGGRFQEQLDVAGYARALAEWPHDLSLMQVAWHGEEIAGQVIPCIERGRGEIDEVSVRPAYRRRGLARALMTRALLELQARDVAVVRLHTVSEFPTQARSLYEALGFRILKRLPRYRKSSDGPGGSPSRPR